MKKVELTLTGITGWRSCRQADFIFSHFWAERTASASLQTLPCTCSVGFRTSRPGALAVVELVVLIGRQLPQPDQSDAGRGLIKSVTRMKREAPLKSCKQYEKKSTHDPVQWVVGKRIR